MQGGFKLGSLRPLQTDTFGIWVVEPTTWHNDWKILHQPNKFVITEQSLKDVSLLKASYNRNKKTAQGILNELPKASEKQNFLQ